VGHELVICKRQLREHHAEHPAAAATGVLREQAMNNKEAAVVVAPGKENSHRCEQQRGSV